MHSAKNNIKIFKLNIHHLYTATYNVPISFCIEIVKGKSAYFKSRKAWILKNTLTLMRSAFIDKTYQTISAEYFQTFSNQTKPHLWICGGIRVMYLKCDHGKLHPINPPPPSRLSSSFYVLWFCPLVYVLVFLGWWWS